MSTGWISLIKSVGSASCAPKLRRRYKTPAANRPEFAAHGPERARGKSADTDVTASGRLLEVAPGRRDEQAGERVERITVRHPGDVVGHGALHVLLAGD